MIKPIRFGGSSGFSTLNRNSIYFAYLSSNINYYRCGCGVVILFFNFGGEAEERWKTRGRRPDGERRVSEGEVQPIKYDKNLFFAPKNVL